MTETAVGILTRNRKVYDSKNFGSKIVQSFAARTNVLLKTKAETVDMEEMFSAYTPDARIVTGKFYTKTDYFTRGDQAKLAFAYCDWRFMNDLHKMCQQGVPQSIPPGLWVNDVAAAREQSFRRYPAKTGAALEKEIPATRGVYCLTKWISTPIELEKALGECHSNREVSSCAHSYQRKQHVSGEQLILPFPGGWRIPDDRDWQIPFAQ
jgi:hypothetical protein